VTSPKEGKLKTDVTLAPKLSMLTKQKKTIFKRKFWQYNFLMKPNKIAWRVKSINNYPKPKEVEIRLIQTSQVAFKH
jgi:hypothetical protein